jgi:hypothetical protein
MRSKAPRFPEDEQIQLMLQQLAGRAESSRIPTRPSRRVIRDIVARRLRAGPLTPGEQMTAVVLLVDHTEGDVAFWESMLGNKALDPSARCTILRVLTYLAELGGRPLRLTMLTADEMEGLVEPRLLLDAFEHLSDGGFIADVHDVLPQLPHHEQLVYWDQAERCRRRAMISAGLMWGPIAFHQPTSPLRDRALDAIDAEPGPAAALLMSQVVRSLGSTRAGALVARRIPAMEAAPRRLDGLDRLKVTALRMTGGKGGQYRRVGFALEHPETVWICGSFDFGPDAGVEASQFDVTTLPPRLNQAGVPADIAVSPISGADLYDELLEGCRHAVREGIDLEYPPLLVLAMLEGTTVKDARATSTLS